MREACIGCGKVFNVNCFSVYHNLALISNASIQETVKQGDEKENKNDQKRVEKFMPSLQIGVFVEPLVTGYVSLSLRGTL